MSKKTKTIYIHEWRTAVEIQTHEVDCVRKRYAYNLKDFNAILKNELIEARELGFEPKIERSGVGKFRGITYKSLHELKKAS
jgi:hypothetical protein